jgi:iron complex outermembrane receptor protein
MYRPAQVLAGDAAAKSRSTRYRLLLCSAAGLAATLALTATAGGAQAADANSTLASNTSSAVTEIVVTAQRRVQSNLDVGESVTVVTPQALKDTHVERVGELIQDTSNVEIREIRPGGGQPAITIRGVGMNDFTVASNPSTSVYFDGVYSPNIGTNSQQIFDMQQVQVLKGPQSTLYGRNATAGAVTIDSVPPTDYFSGYGTVSYGNYESIDAEGAVSGPLAENLSARLSLKTRQMLQGWIDNTYPGGEMLGTLNQSAVRGQLQWKPTDRFSLRGIFNYQYEDDAPGAMTAFGRHVPGGTPTTATPICAVSAANQIDFNNACASLFGAQRTTTNVLSLSENDSWNVLGNMYTGTVLGGYEGDGFTIKSTTGYVNWHEIYNKADGLPITEQHYVLNQATWQASQDLMIASTGKRRLDWMAGIYGSWANTNDPTYSTVPINKANYIGTNSLDTRTAQIYVQLDYHLTDQLTLGVGARYIYEYDHKIGGTWINKNGNNWTIEPNDPRQAFISDSIYQNAVSWKVHLDYKPNATTLVYASVTHGFKSGGFTAPAIATNSAQLAPYKGEDLYAFEIGGKKDLFDHKISLESALFYYDYFNFQTNEQQLVNNLNINIFANLPHANVKGLDLSAAFRPIDGLELKLDGGWVGTWVGQFASGGVVHPAGNNLPNAPSFAGTASIRYQRSVTQDFDMAIGASVHRQGAVYADTENTALYRIGSAATLVDAQLQLLMPAHKWSVMLWVKNLTDCEYTNSTYQNGSTVNTLYNMPRTFGVSFNKSF